MMMRDRLLAAGLAALLFSTGIPAAAAQEDADEAAALAALAERYAPRVVVREQAEACGPGEAYQPADVTDVLGRDDVTLRPVDGSELPAPAAQDLATADADTHLDLPGNPLDPGCDYDQWSKQVSGATPPTLYANAATDPGHPGQLALQYWFYWVFNDWNNRHEGDWEMIQIIFPAATAAEALEVDPTSVAFAQHEGSETAQWDDPKLRKDGTHPVVYPSEGSHAAYYDQARWFGKSAAAGFGCDDTSVSPTVPGVLWQPQIEVLGGPEAEGQEWLAYPGRWGQQAPSFNNGPTGPNTKRQWTQPIAWQEEEGRSGAVAIPAIPGPAVGAFCSVTTGGSLLFLQVLDQPVLTVAAAAALVAALLLLIRGTVWRGADVSRYDRERRSGQILTAAIGIYLRRLPVLGGLSAAFLAASALALLLSDRILQTAVTDSLIDTKGATDALTVGLSAAVALAVRGPVIVLVVAAAIAVVAQEERRVGIADALRRAVVPPTTALLLAGTYLVVVALAATVVLLPLALWLVARWASAGPAAMVEGQSLRSALGRSAELTHRKRVRTLLLMALFLVALSVPGPLAGAVLLLVTPLPFAVVNALVAVTFAVALPIFGVALTLQFYDLRQERVRDGIAEPA